MRVSPSIAVVVLSCFVAAVRAQAPPAISTDTQGNVTVTGNDLALGYGNGMGSISLRQLAADVDALKQATALLQNATAMFPTTLEVSTQACN